MRESSINILFFSCAVFPPGSSMCIAGPDGPGREQNFSLPRQFGLTYNRMVDWRRIEAVITSSTRNRVVGSSRHVGSNPTVSVTLFFRPEGKGFFFSSFPRQKKTRQKLFCRVPVTVCFPAQLPLCLCFSEAVALAPVIEVICGSFVILLDFFPQMGNVDHQRIGI